MVYDGLKGVTRPASCHFPFILLPTPANLPKSKCQHACKQNFQLKELMVWSALNEILDSNPGVRKFLQGTAAC